MVLHELHQGMVQLAERERMDGVRWGEITCAMLATRFPWVSITPLGTPVVPEL